MVATAAGCGNVANEMPRVSGAFGESAEITIPSADPRGYSVSTLISGDGPVTRPGDVVDIRFSIVSWESGQSLGSSHEQQVSIPVTAAPAETEGLNEALIGKRVGSRVLVVLPQSGMDETGAEVTETAVIALDVMSIRFRAPDGPVTQAGAGLPTVGGRRGHKPEVTIPSTDPPAELVAHTLIPGDGDVVEAGDAIVAQYVGVIWSDGRQFDASWDRGSPASFPVGQGQVIPAWDKAIVGTRIGSRVLIVAPPAEGYGSEGNEQAGILGTDTLVFVVDVLGVVPEG